MTEVVQYTQNSVFVKLPDGDIAHGVDTPTDALAKDQPQ